MIEYKIITDKTEKQKHREEFKQFFQCVYGKALTDSIWNHQFVNTPYENSPLFLAIYDNKIVGSALMIPQKLLLDNQELSYYLFTTSTIMEEYRKKGIYAKLLDLIKKYAFQRNKDFIMAFPNMIAYTALKLFGGFKDITKLEIVRSGIGNIDFDKAHNSLKIDSSMARWRFEHKEYRFAKVRNNIIIYKYFDNSIDLLAIVDKNVFMNSEIQFSPLGDKPIVTIMEYLIKDSAYQKIATLNATYLPIQPGLRLDGAKLNLLMWDVF